MSDQVLNGKNGKQSWDKNLNVTLNECLQSKESSQEILNIISRKVEEHNLFQPIRGAHPAQADDAGKNPRLSLVIALNDKEDEVVSVEEIDMILNAKTSVSTSKVMEKAVIPLETDGLFSIPFIRLQKDGHPGVSYQSAGKNAKTLNNAQVVLEDEVLEAIDEMKSEDEVLEATDEMKSVSLPDRDLLLVKLKTEPILDNTAKGDGKQEKCGCNEIVPSTKKKNDHWYRQKIAKRMTFAAIAILDFISGRKLNFAAGCLVLLFGVAHAFTGPNNKVVRRGEEADLTCYTNTGHPIKWFKEQKLIFSGYQFTANAINLYAMANQSQGHYNLSINCADEKIVGYYTCQQSLDVKNITAAFIVIDFNCSTVVTNVITAVCGGVVIGSTVTEFRWQIIHKDGVTDALGNVTFNKSDIINKIRRQNITIELILSGSDIHADGLCRLTLTFDYTKRSEITLGPAEKLADNIPTYTFDVLCNTSTLFQTTQLSTDKWKIIAGICVPVAVLLIIIAVVRKYRRRRRPQ